MKLLVVLALAYAALAALSLAMPRHHAQVFRVAPTRLRRRALRVSGWLLLVLSFAIAIAASGWQIGPVHWLGFLSVAGLVLVPLLAYAPRLGATLAALCAVAALACLA